MAAFAYVNWLTAELVAVNKNNSLPFVSKIDVPILGDVNVLFVKVCVPVSVTVPAVASDISTISGLVESLPYATTNLSPLSVAEKVTELPDPDAYLN